MSLDIARAKRRLILMGVVDIVALVVAVAAAVAFFAYGLEWALGLFAAALVAGFAAQIWFILGLRRTDKGV